MKHILIAIAFCSALTANAQTWNPDSDFDNLIGLNDLMSLLSVYGSEWTAEYPQDSAYELAAYHAGLMNPFECIRTCYSNGARVITAFEYAIFQDSIESVIEESMTAYAYYAHQSIYSLLDVANIVDPNYVSFSGNNSTSYNRLNRNSEFNCFCTGLVPAVE